MRYCKRKDYCSWIHSKKQPQRETREKYGKKMLTEYQWVNQNMQASSLINMLCEGGQKKKKHTHTKIAAKISKFEIKAVQKIRKKWHWEIL